MRTETDVPDAPGAGQRRTARRGGRTVAAVSGLAAVALAVSTGLPALADQSRAKGADRPAPGVESRVHPVLEVDGLEFRDLDGSGDLTPYEDWRLSANERAADLVSRLSVAEKAGQLMHGSLANDDAGYDVDAFRTRLENRHITTFISRFGTDAAELAAAHNDLQELAEQQPFGIPLKISTDPRNGFTVKAGQTVGTADFTAFPDPIGMGAVGDPGTTRRMADVVRREYRAAGIHEALSPQADLATEPRWTRIDGTYGSVGTAVRDHVRAYVEGMQGEGGISADGVTTVTKHWAGYGAQVNGYDSHYHYGRYASFEGGNFAEHLLPYEGAFEAGAAGIMPTYSILKDLEINGEPVEQVGAGHNEYLLQDLLRGEYGFGGVVTSDWGIVNDCPEACRALQPPEPFWGAHGVGMPWGVEDMTLPERYASALNAGVDIIGGSDTPEHIVAAVREGLLSGERLDEAARRVLEQKFELGLFENPYVDPAAAERTVGSAASRAFADRVQARSLTLLANDDGALPVRGAAGRTVYLHGVSAEAATAAGLTPVDDPAAADLAIVRLEDPRGGDDLTDLDFTGDEEDFAALSAAAEAGATTIAVPNLSRPLVLTDVTERADAVLASYGVSDAVLVRTILGRSAPEGRLPFALPSTMESVEQQLGDVPNDEADPLFEYGAGLSY